MTGILVWDGTCSCHGPEDSAAERDKCCRNGRRSPEAYDYAMPRLEAVLNGIRQWRASGTGDDVELLWQAQACTRATFLSASEKLELMETILWLLSKLHLLGVHDRCVSQFGEVLVDRHHSVSILFLGPESDLINGVRTMNSKGGGMSDGRHLRRRKSRVHETRAASLQGSYLELAVQLAAVMQTDAGNMWTCKRMETPVRMAPCTQWHRLQL